MSPATLINGIDIHEECVNFAKERNVFSPGDEIEAVNLRMRHGNFVVDLDANAPGERALKSRTCVVGSNSICIVSIRESGFWR
jgi:hypothetical protein